MISKIVLFLSYTSIMMSAVFIPNYALAIGATLPQIGLIGASYGFSLFFSSYIFGRASDMKGRKKFIVTGLLLSAAAFSLQIIATTPRALLIVRALSGTALGIFTAPLAAYAFEKGTHIGTFSSYGSFGWAFGGLLAGAAAQKTESIASANPLMPFWSVFALSSLFFLVAYFTVLRLPETTIKPRPMPLFPSKLLMKNLGVYASAFLRHLGAYAIWIIFPLFLFEIGANKFWIGVLYFINMGSQGIIMRRLNYADETMLIKTGLLLSAAVFMAYTLVDNYVWIIPLQLLLALSYSFIYVGDLTYLINRNEEKAVSVGLLHSIIGICIGLGPVIGGVVSQLYGFAGVMRVASFMALIGYFTVRKSS